MDLVVLYCVLFSGTTSLHIHSVNPVKALPISIQDSETIVFFRERTHGPLLSRIRSPRNWGHLTAFAPPYIPDTFEAAFRQNPDPP